jgi:hypothetical protein
MVRKLSLMGIALILAAFSFTGNAYSQDKKTTSDDGVTIDAKADVKVNQDKSVVMPAVTIDMKAQQIVNLLMTRMKFTVDEKTLFNTVRSHIVMNKNNTFKLDSWGRFKSDLNANLAVRAERKSLNGMRKEINSILNENTKDPRMDTNK